MIDEEPEFERQPRHDAASEVSRLIAANAASNATMTRLVEKVREDAEKREQKVALLEAESRQMRRLLTLVGIAIGLLLALAVVNAFSIQEARRNAQRTGDIASNAASTNKLLLSCFDATSECARLNAAAQKRQNDDLKAYQLSLAYCQFTTEARDGKAFLDCIAKRYPDGPKLPE